MTKIYGFLWCVAYGFDRSRMSIHFSTFAWTISMRSLVSLRLSLERVQPTSSLTTYGCRQALSPLKNDSQLKNVLSWTFKSGRVASDLIVVGAFCWFRSRKIECKAHDGLMFRKKIAWVICLFLFGKPRGDKADWSPTRLAILFYICQQNMQITREWWLDRKLSTL